MSPAYWADIIHEAAQSELGLLALTILLVAAVAFAFFRKASEYVRLAVFLMILVSAVLFGSAIVRIWGTPRNSSATASPQTLIAGSAEALRAVQNVTDAESRFYWRVLMENPERSAVLQRSVLLALEARRRGGGPDAEQALRDALVLLSRPTTRMEHDAEVTVIAFSYRKTCSSLS